VHSCPGEHVWVVHDVADMLGSQIMHWLPGDCSVPAATGLPPMLHPVQVPYEQTRFPKPAPQAVPSPFVVQAVVLCAGSHSWHGFSGFELPDA
jgi:hypothetical protein